MNEDQGQEIFKVEREKVSAVGKMDMSGAFGASSINVEKVQGAENFGKLLLCTLIGHIAYGVYQPHGVPAVGAQPEGL